MEFLPDVSIFLVLTTLVVGAFVVILTHFKGNQGKSQGKRAEGKGPFENGSKESSEKNPKHCTKHAKKAFSFSHSLLHTSLKGHSGNVLGSHFSINGKYFVTTADDRTVRLWSVKDFGAGNKSVRVNVELDHAKYIQFSPDSRAFIVGLAHANTVRVFRLSKKDDGTTICMPLENDFTEDHRQELLNIGVGATSSGGSFVMTAYKDTTIKIRDIKGEVLHEINTNLGTNNYACVSPCGRYVAACGWTPDVKVWEIRFTRTGAYKDAVRAFELKGHRSSVWSFAFNNDSTRMFTVSKDGTWRFFETEVEYEKGQEPCLLTSGEFNVNNLPATDNYCHAALSFDGRVAAIGLANSFCVLSTRTGTVDAVLVEVHSELLSSLAFDVSGRFLVSSGDRHLRVFHNIPGYKENISELKGKMKKLAPQSASWERLESQRHKLERELQEILSR